MITETLKNSILNCQQIESWDLEEGKEVTTPRRKRRGFYGLTPMACYPIPIGYGATRKIFYQTGLTLLV